MASSAQTMKGMTHEPILVIGARGQLARALARYGCTCGHPIVGRGRPLVDLAEPASVERVIAELSPVAVMNAAAYTAVDKAEGDWATAFAVNAEGPERLARTCAHRDIPLIHGRPTTYSMGLRAGRIAKAIRSRRSVSTAPPRPPARRRSVKLVRATSS